MKKIELIGSHLTGHGGEDNVIKYILKDKFINSKLDLSFFCLDKIPDQEFLDGISKDRINISNHSNKFLNLLRFAFFLITYKGDALIMTGDKQIYVASCLRKLFRKKYRIISWVHFSPAGSDFMDVKKIIKADNHLVISNGIARQLINAGVSPDKINTIYNPVEKHSKTILPSKDECTFVYVGRMNNSQKNILGLLKNITNLKGNWKFNVYGSGEDLEAAKNIVNNNKNLKQRVSFKGWSSNPWQGMDSANALILNSNFEGFPLTLAEAMSYGIPCVSTDCQTGPSDIIKNGTNGFLYPIDDYKKMNAILSGFINGKYHFDPEEIKSSINEIYSNEYSKTFVSSVLGILK